jgi:ABC-type uncharacterized transport system substrate-binding protein
VLRESWNSNLPLFSSNVLHVKKGALFAMVPDNVELGRTLAASAMGVIAGEVRRRPLVPLRELQTAINLRTASHIGLNLARCSSAALISCTHNLEPDDYDPQFLRRTGFQRQLTIMVSAESWGWPCFRR